MVEMDQITLGVALLPKKTPQEILLQEKNHVMQWTELVALFQPRARGAHQPLVRSTAVPHCRMNHGQFNHNHIYFPSNQWQHNTRKSSNYAKWRWYILINRIYITRWHQIGI